VDTPLVWVQLAGIAVVILVAAHFLAGAAGAISARTGLGRSFIGVVLLATATSLPELATGVSSVTLVGEPDLAAGDAFGSNLFNLLIIALLDLVWRRGPILTVVGPTSVVIGTIGAATIGLAAIAIAIHGATDVGSGWPVSPFSMALLLVFGVGMYAIYRYDTPERATDPADHERPKESVSGLPRAVGTYAAAGAVVVGASVALSVTGQQLADAMGWETSFVGTQFLALSTSLPELATSFAAIRLRLPEMAISNLLGSNLFNMGVVLFLDDVAYTEGALWSVVSPVHVLTGLVAVAMTSIVILALVRRPRGRPIRQWTWEAAALVTLYAGVSVMVFRLG